VPGFYWEYTEIFLIKKISDIGMPTTTTTTQNTKYNYRNCIGVGNFWKSLSLPCKAQYLKIMWTLLVHKDTESCRNKFFLASLVECIVHTAVCQKAHLRLKQSLIELAVIRLCLSEGISQAASQVISHLEENSVKYCRLDFMSIENSCAALQPTTSFYEKARVLITHVISVFQKV